MNKKLVIITILIMLFIFGAIAFLLVSINEERKESEEKSSALVDEILKKVDNKEDVLIFVKDEEEDFYLSQDAEKFIDYYERNYNLDFIRVDRSKIMKKDYKRIIDKFYITEEIIQIPFAILVKKGEFQIMVNQLVMESYLRNHLIEYGFIDEKYDNIDQSISYEKFKELYASNEKSLFAIYTYNDGSSYEIRDKLFEISKESLFNYYVVYSGVSDNAQISNLLSEELGDDFSIPSLVIVQDNKVVDYVNSTDKNEIMEFLRDNDYID